MKHLGLGVLAVALLLGVVGFSVYTTSTNRNSTQTNAAKKEKSPIVAVSWANNCYPSGEVGAPGPTKCRGNVAWVKNLKLKNISRTPQAITIRAEKHRCTEGIVTNCVSSPGYKTEVKTFKRTLTQAQEITLADLVQEVPKDNRGSCGSSQVDYIYTTSSGYKSEAYWGLAMTGFNCKPTPPPTASVTPTPTPVASVCKVEYFNPKTQTWGGGFAQTMCRKEAGNIDIKARLVSLPKPDTKALIEFAYTLISPLPPGQDEATTVYTMKEHKIGDIFTQTVWWPGYTDETSLVEIHAGLNTHKVTSPFELYPSCTAGIDYWWSPTVMCDNY